MSKKNNIVNPDHFKTAGREPQGRGVAHDLKHQQFEETKAKEKHAPPRAAAKSTAKPGVSKGKPTK